MKKIANPIKAVIVAAVVVVGLSITRGNVQANTCNIAGCKQAGVHAHENTCNIAGCKQEGEHVHKNACNVTGCKQEGEHAHSDRLQNGRHHGHTNNGHHRYGGV